MQVEHNTLTKAKQAYSIDYLRALNNDALTAEIEILASNVPKVYSYAIFADKQPATMLRIELLYSYTKRYNTISIPTIVDAVKHTINTAQGDKLVAYKQPPLDILIHTYEPLILKLAKQQQEHWKQLELDDLMQMARLCICILYNSGYYVHKKLIIRTFNNYVLQTLRKERYRPTILSLDAPLPQSDRLTIGDVIRDTSYDERMQNEEDREEDITFLKEFRAIVIRDIGERQYEQLLKQYSAKATSAWATKRVHDLKAKYAKLNTVKQIRRKMQ